MKFSFHIYKESVISKLKEHLQETDVKLLRNPKNNGVEKEGILLRGKSMTISPIIYIDDFKNVYDDDDVTRFVENAIHSYKETVQCNKERIADIQCWEKVKEKVRPRLISYERNKERLKNGIPFVKLLDLAVTFVLPMRGLLLEYEEGTIRVNDSLMKAWNIDEEFLYQKAIENMEKEGYEFVKLGSVLKDHLPGNEGILQLLTCYEGVGGAATILSKKILKEVCQQMKCDQIYLLPSSIHELLILDANENQVHVLQRVVRDVNSNFLEAEDFLSDEVYEYDNRTCELRIAEVTENVDTNGCLHIGCIA